MTARPPKVADPATLPIPRSDFEQFFKINSLGYVVAREAVRQGVIGTPYEMVETVCAANESIGKKLLERVTAATKRDLIAEPEPLPSAKALDDLVMATFGERGFDQLLRDLFLEVAQEFHVSLTSSSPPTYRTYALWADVIDTEPS
jgi:hypothetical protein